MNNLLTQTIQSLITTYPNYNKEDILVLHTLAPYADPEAFTLINSFLYANGHMDNEINHTLLQTALSILEEESLVTN